MPALQDISNTFRLRLEQLGTADVAIGLTADEKLYGPESLQAVAAAIGSVPAIQKAVVFHTGTVSIDSNERVSFVSVPSSAADGMRSALIPPISYYRALFEAADGLQCRACAALSSDPAHLSSDEMQALIKPVLSSNADMVVAQYAERKLDALMNRSILYPLARALYGKRLRFPMAGDFAVSPKFVQMLQAIAATPQGADTRLMSLEAIRRDLDIAQATFGPRRLSPVESAPDPSTVLSQVAGSLFLDIERNAAHWQRTRGSRPVPVIGTAPALLQEDDTPTQVDGLIETFRLAYRNLMEVWPLLLPPGTLVELRRLTTTELDRFRLPDRTWVRIVYDFALGYRIRVISRDHLLGAMTPLPRVGGVACTRDPDWDSGRSSAAGGTALRGLRSREALPDLAMEMAGPVQPVSMQENEQDVGSSTSCTQ
ncbi:MAG: hypothetical protein ACRD7E_06670 [Bryobacteraceae bacterium]